MSRCGNQCWAVFQLVASSAIGLLGDLNTQHRARLNPGMAGRRNRNMGQHPFWSPSVAWAPRTSVPEPHANPRVSTILRRFPMFADPPPRRLNHPYPRFMFASTNPQRIRGMLTKTVMKSGDCPTPLTAHTFCTSSSATRSGSPIPPAFSISCAVANLSNSIFPSELLIGESTSATLPHAGWLRHRAC